MQDKNTGITTIVVDDQLAEAGSTSALLKTYECQKPLALIIDDKYELFPYNLGTCMYAVLGFYWIVAAWGMYCY